MVTQLIVNISSLFYTYKHIIREAIVKKTRITMIIKINLVVIINIESIHKSLSI